MQKLPKVTKYVPKQPVDLSTIDSSNPVYFSKFCRTKKVVEMILEGKKVVQIAKHFGVDRSTIMRDVQRWSQSNDAAFLKTEWLEAYADAKINNKDLAFNNLTTLLKYFMSEQAKANINVTTTNQTLTINNNGQGAGSEVSQMLGQYQKLVFGTVASQTTVEVEHISINNSKQQICEVEADS
ncbi:MAG: hypothetical protein FWE56_01980 [Candidatus Bathyarchaeota archaeon]|nr:hypothetical protein [Candidatus Termiticorpusculum sp.]MCL2868390.1 hypothetical protein [Candidatus Termiticorpusculum sp.]